MEIIVALVIAFGAYQWGASSSPEDALEDSVQVAQEEVDASTDGQTEYLKHDSYYIKDLTVRATAPEGCYRPVLTTNLAEPAKEGVRTVTEVKTSCEG